jgi:hypothetical protein
VTDQGVQGREAGPWLSSLPQYFSFSWLWAIPTLCALGVGGMLIYVSQVPGGVRWSVFATALALATAAFLAGGVIGFLFGVPHTVQSSAPSTGGTHYLGNTNLEQVSDWLTKIIVGVGLVQIGRAVPALSKLAAVLKAPLGGQPSSGTFGLALVISYFLLGFLHLYLWSRALAAREFAIYDAKQQQNDADESRRSVSSSEFRDTQELGKVDSSYSRGDPTQLNKPSYFVSTGRYVFMLIFGGIFLFPMTIIVVLLGRRLTENALKWVRAKTS